VESDPRIAIFGAGAWGTALAIKLGARFDVVLWARDAALAEAIERSRATARYLQGFALPDRIHATADFAAAARDADCRIVATTAAGLLPTVSSMPRQRAATLSSFTPAPSLPRTSSSRTAR
jgi:glycerol-3-phosphate dehydrogenase (NAD(P)+)